MTIFSSPSPHHRSHATAILSSYSLDGSEGELFVYVENDIALATATLDAMEKGRWWLCSVAVHRDHRRQGIGKKIVSDVVARVASDEVWLETMFWNRRFYESLGFRFIPISEAIHLLGRDPRLHERRSTMVMMR